MKSKLYLLFLVPALMVTGCDDAKQILQAFGIVPYSGEFQLFEDVKGNIHEMEESRSYVWYDGEIYEVSDLAANANTDTETHCIVDGDGILTNQVVDVEERRGVGVRRYVGQQTAWAVRESNDGNNIMNSASVGTLRSLDGADIYLMMPMVTPNDQLLSSDDDDSTTGEFFSSESTTARGVEWYTEYWQNKVIEEIQLYFYEQAQYFREFVTTTTTWRYDDIVTTTVETSDNDSSQELMRQWHIPFDSFIWSVGESDFESLENVFAPNVGAELMVPENVQVGDTWMSDEDGNVFAAAITTQELTMANGVTYTALVIIERGTEGNNVVNENIFNDCVVFYNEVSTTNNGVTQPVDSVELSANSFDWCEGSGTMDFVNVATYWYFAGHVIKADASYTELDITERGYARLDPDTGVCQFNSDQRGSLPVVTSTTEATEYKPFIRFDRVQVWDYFMATEITQTNVLLDGFEREFGDNAGDEAPSEGTETTTTTTETTE